MPLLNNDYLPFIQFNPSLTGLSVRFVCPMIIKIIPLHLSRDKSLCPLDLNLNDCVITLSPCCKHFTPSHIIMWELSPKKLLISKLSLTVCMTTVTDVSSISSRILTKLLRNLFQISTNLKSPARQWGLSNMTKNCYISYRQGFFAFLK